MTDDDGQLTDIVLVFNVEDIFSRPELRNDDALQRHGRLQPGPLKPARLSADPGKLS